MGQASKVGGVQGESRKKLQVQMRAWREDLLSIDRRQKLVYFQHPKTGSFEIVEPGMLTAEQLIRTGDLHLLSAEADDESGDSAAELGLPAVRDGRVLLVSGKSNKQILNTCKRLHQRSEQEYADRGVWILYMGLGMLNWVDPADGKKVSSPLLMVPVRLTKAGQVYVLNRTEDEPFLNTALSLKMSRDFGIELPEVEDEEVSIAEVSSKVQAAVSAQPAWSVEPRVILMPFSFHKEAMYKDLEQNEEAIIANDLIQTLSLGPDAPNAASFGYEPPSDDELDTIIAPESLHSILDADGSQRRCIIAARAGTSFVMDGPPGTGKSQTIANIIAELIATGKTVLFVSEKAAALDVVRDRLADRNLDPFLLELHSHKATRKQVVKTLHDELVKRPVARSKFGDVEKNRLGAARTQLTEYSQAMNVLQRPLGRSLHDVLGRLSQLTDVENFPTGEKSKLSKLTAEQLSAILQLAAQLSKVWRPAEEGEAFLWRGLQGESMSVSEIKNAETAALIAADVVRTVLNGAEFFDSTLPFMDFGLNDKGLQSRLELLRVFAEAREVPASWWTSTDSDELNHRAAALGRLTAERATLISEVSELFGNRWDITDGELAAPLTAAIDTGEGEFKSSLRDLSLSHIHEAEEHLVEFIAAFVRLQTSSGELAAFFNVDASAVTLAKLDSMIALARLSQSGNLPEPQWLNPSIQGALNESARVLDGLTGVVRERQEALGSIFKPDVLALDLIGLKVRFETEHKGLKAWSKRAREDKKTLRGVTHTGTVNKDIVGMLGEAVEWQQAQQNLHDGETEYSPRLGNYYQGTKTDFGRLSSALELAREAIRLAGQDVAPSALASQLSRNAEPAAGLIPAADKVQDQINVVRSVADSLFAQEFWQNLGDIPLSDVMDSMTTLKSHLEDSAESRARLKDLGGGQLILQRGTEILGKIGWLRDLEKSVEQTSDEDRMLIGPRYQGFLTRWDEVDADREWCAAAREVLGVPVDATAVPFLEDFKAGNHLLADSVGSWRTAKRNLLEFFDEQQRHELEENLDSSLSSAGELLDEMAQVAGSDIDIWYEFNRLVDVLSEYGLAPTLSALEAKTAPAAQVSNAIERAALEPWAEAVIASDKRLSSHRAESREQLVKNFRGLDSLMVQDAFSAIVDACASRRPRSNAGPAAVIANEANKKSRHKPIRKLLEETDSIVQAIKPCFMMSPLSVSQYLPAGFSFDVVIFDEASQVRPADAVNCIYRGRQLIVAGDQKQLPPTAFFASGDSDSEEEDIPDDFDSVLDLCKASGSLPSLPLTWHYRSRHEDLITYSNYRFYEGKLNTFPGATHLAQDLGVHHEFVQGVYRRGGDRKNTLEAAKVVDRIVEHRRSKPELSVGVVTFSQAQAEAVSEEIERRSDTEPLLKGLMEDHDRLRGFFVKNLESVQGDERDIIIFSIGYGPDEHGKFTMAFGPLTKKGGERRLNVAITRARQRVEVVSSFRASDMQETPSDGNRHLKNYLDFAERGHAALAADMSGSVGDVESPFEEEVVRTIRSWGYEAIPQVGSAGYRIDIGIRHPDQPGRFVLGVECDGAAYHSAKTARDRDRLRESVLCGLGWNIHRIWGISWYRDRSAQELRLKSAIEAAVRGDIDFGPTKLSWLKDDHSVPEIDFHEVDLTAAPEWTVEYRKYVKPNRRYRTDPGKPEALPDLISFCSEVLAVEAPMHIDTILERVKLAWGVSSAGSRIRSNVQNALGMAKVNGVRAKQSADGFVRIPGSRPVLVRKPSDDDSRTVGLIPPEEIDEAVVRVIADAVFADEEQIRLSVRKVFGWDRAGQNIQTAIQKSLFRVVQERRCVKTTSGNYSRA